MSQNVVVGLVFFAGLGLLLYFTVIADPEALRPFGIKTADEEKENIIEVTFSDAGGMSAGTRVMASGMKIGAVRDLTYQKKTGKVKVKMAIWEDLYLYKGHEFVVKPESALGGQYVDVNIGDPETEQVDYLNEGRVQPDALAAVGGLIDENRANLRASIANIRKVTEDMAQGRGTLGMLVADRAAYDQLMEILDEVRTTVALAREGEGTVAKLLNDPVLYDQLRDAADNIRDITDKINRGEGTLGPLVNDDAAYQDLRAALDNLNRTLEDVRLIVADVRAGKGSAGKFFTDPSLFDNFNAAAKNIAEVSEKINRGEGTLGKLLTDDEVYEGIAAIVGNVREVSEDVNRGKGTIGKLVKDETLYFELRKAVRSITASVEDAREQAPVSLFTSIIFNAF